MDMLKTKLRLLGDLSDQHIRSLQSLQSVRNSFQTMLEDLQKQISAGVRQKSQFRTKIGVSVRESLLELYGTIVTPIHDTFMTIETVYSQMLQRQLSIEEVIRHGHPLINHLEQISSFINQTSQRYDCTRSALKAGETSFSNIRRLQKSLSECPDKENWRSENVGEKGEKYKLNMLMIARQGSQSFIKASQKIKQFQIMEFSLVVDQCLEFVADTRFILEKPEFPKDHSASLGINSRREVEEIDLLCDEDITLALPLPLPNKSLSEDLQRITEREQELESDSPSVRRTLKTIEQSSPS